MDSHLLLKILTHLHAYSPGADACHPTRPFPSPVPKKIQAQSAWQQLASNSFYATTPPRVVRLSASRVGSLQTAPFFESLRYTEGTPTETFVPHVAIRV